MIKKGNEIMGRMKCPKCEAVAMVPIVYGLPASPPPDWKRGEEEYVLGGCVISPDSPTHFCTNCQHESFQIDALAMREGVSAKKILDILSDMGVTVKGSRSLINKETARAVMIKLLQAENHDHSHEIP